MVDVALGNLSVMATGTIMSMIALLYYILGTMYKAVLERKVFKRDQRLHPHFDSYERSWFFHVGWFATAATTVVVYTVFYQEIYDSFSEMNLGPLTLLLITIQFLLAFVWLTSHFGVSAVSRWYIFIVICQVLCCTVVLVLALIKLNLWAVSLLLYIGPVLQFMASVHSNTFRSDILGR